MAPVIEGELLDAAGMEGFDGEAHVTISFEEADGRTTMTVDGEQVPTSSLSELMLQDAFDLDSYITMFEGDDDSATYDGEVSDGDVLEIRFNV